MTQTDAPKRTVISVSGPDRFEFLQGLITNDVARLSEGLIYSALLTPQGKYLFDFFLFEREGAVLIDAVSERAQQLSQLLSFYKLRKSVSIAPSDIEVTSGLGTVPPGAMPDPRCPQLGWRQYGGAGKCGTEFDWDAIRVEHCIPESGIELLPNTTFILEAGFERLNGVDFHKGCYVGQEVTARMKHKKNLAKGLATVLIEGNAQRGTEILSNGRQVGKLSTRSGNKAIAFLRFDRLGQAPMSADGSAVRMASGKTKWSD